MPPIVPVTYAPDKGATTSDNAPPGIEAAMTLLQSGFLFWVALSAAPGMMTGTLLATDPALLAAASNAEVTRAHERLWSILPASDRADGLINDARLAGNPQPAAIQTITAPLLTISVEDDRFGTTRTARHIASMVTGARLAIFPTGGHIWLGHNQELFDRVDSFLQEIGYA
ncbi:MAG: hypothetical protein MO852_06455 [Candidatus Devosia euplotis]|nr:hypothetical protein [Candidatus Devosia euplotis]